MEKDTFPDFPYPATQVVRFIQSNDLFSCLLDNGHVIHFTAHDAQLFKAWLLAHNVVDVRMGKGS